MTSHNNQLTSVQIIAGVDAEYDETVDLVEFHFTNTDPSRRDFLHVLGAGLLIAVTANTVQGQDPKKAARKGGGGGMGGRGATSIAARLHIGKDGALTVMTGKVECGQGARAELTQAAAEELRVAAERVRLIMADTALVPDDGGTFGSRSTPSSMPAIRQGCASARELLAATAARRWGVDAKAIEVRDGKAYHDAFGRHILLCRSGDGRERNQGVRDGPGER